MGKGDLKSHLVTVRFKPGYLECKLQTSAVLSSLVKTPETLVTFTVLGDSPEDSDSVDLE